MWEFECRLCLFIKKLYKIFHQKLQTGLGSDNLYHGSIDCFLKILKQHGVRGLFKGSMATFWRECPPGGIQLFFFFSYKSPKINSIKRHLFHNIWILLPIFHPAWEKEKGCFCLGYRLIRKLGRLCLLDLMLSFRYFKDQNARRLFHKKQI